jgi:hypothetical protein
MFGQENGGSILFQDENGQTATSSKLQYNSTRGILTGLEGIYLMPDNSNPYNIRYGSWYGGMIWGGEGGCGFGLFGSSGEPYFWIQSNGMLQGEQQIPDSVYSMGSCTNNFVRFKVTGLTDNLNTFAYYVENRANEGIFFVRDDRRIGINQGYPNAVLDIAGVQNGLNLLVVRDVNNSPKVVVNSDGNLTAPRLNISNIPTSAAGLSTGDIYSDNGSLKIVQ